MIRTTILAVGLLGLASSPLFAAGQRDVAMLRAATAGYHNIPTALADGFEFVPGISECMELPGVGGMGYHLLNVERIDTIVEPLKPEVLVYVPGPNGKMHLGAIEYLVPADAWDAEGHAELPSAWGHHFHLNPAIGMYILHVWIWRQNPAGMFEDWNPKVSCP